MQNFMILALALRALGCLASITGPLFRFLRSGTTLNSYWELSLFVGAVGVLTLVGVSTSSPTANVAIVGTGLACGLLQAVLLLGTPSTLIRVLLAWSILSWLLLALLAALTADWGTPQVAHLPDGTRCEVLAYGASVSDQGDIYALYRRLGIVDVRLERYRHSYVYGPTLPDQEWALRCMRALRAR